VVYPSALGSISDFPKSCDHLILMIISDYVQQYTLASAMGFTALLE